MRPPADAIIKGVVSSCSLPDHVGLPLAQEVIRPAEINVPRELLGPPCDYEKHEGWKREVTGSSHLRALVAAELRSAILQTSRRSSTIEKNIKIKRERELWFLVIFRLGSSLAAHLYR